MVILPVVEYYVYVILPLLMITHVATNTVTTEYFEPFVKLDDKAFGFPLVSGEFGGVRPLCLLLLCQPT